MIFAKARIVLRVALLVFERKINAITSNAGSISQKNL
jgi:hypothetical protein